MCFNILLTVHLNRLTPNDLCISRTAPPTSKRCILYIYSTNIGTEYFKHALYSPFFSLQNAVCFIMLTCLVPVLLTFYVQGVLKLKKNNSGAKGLICVLSPQYVSSSHNSTINCSPPPCSQESFVAYVQRATLTIYFDRYGCTFTVATAWPAGVLLQFYGQKVLHWSCTCVA